MHLPRLERPETSLRPRRDGRDERWKGALRRVLPFRLDGAVNWRDYCGLL